MFLGQKCSPTPPALSQHFALLLLLCYCCPRGGVDLIVIEKALKIGSVTWLLISAYIKPLTLKRNSPGQSITHHAVSPMIFIFNY